MCAGLALRLPVGIYLITSRREASYREVVPAPADLAPAPGPLATQQGPFLASSPLLTLLQNPFFFFFFVNLFILFIYFWLRWVLAVHRLSLVAASGGYSWLRCAGFSLQWLLLLRSTGSRCAGFSSCGT